MSLRLVRGSPRPPAAGLNPSLSQHLRLRGVLREGSGGAGEGRGGHVHPRQDEVQAQQDLHGLPPAAEVGPAAAHLRAPPLTLRAWLSCWSPSSSPPVTTSPLCRSPACPSVLAPFISFPLAVCPLPCEVLSSGRTGTCVPCPLLDSPVSGRGLAGGVWATTCRVGAWSG